MLKGDADAVEEDLDGKEIFQEIYDNGDDSELTRLTEMVRNHYLNYLEKQLHENLLSSNYLKKNGIHKEEFDEMCTKSIKKTAEQLEDKAVKACMIAKLYQRAMVKIIAIVRRTTQEKRLLTQLEKCIQTPDVNKKTSYSKETQTEYEFQEKAFCPNELPNQNESVITDFSVDKEDEKILSLDEKIEMFKKHLQKEKCIDEVKSCSSRNKQKKSKKDLKYKNEAHSHRKRHKHREIHHSAQKQEINLSSKTNIVTKQNTSISPVSNSQPIDLSLIENKDAIKEENENSYDSVALELARLFSEEKTELDEIFGIDPNEEPDDPQICKILKEIEAAKVETKSPTRTVIKIDNVNPPSEPFPEPSVPKNVHSTTIVLGSSTDLSKSIWPCELFMQRRKLSESLARLIEEDLRWHEIIKWKFYELFGEDSDDEFAPCSPSIELNEILLGSCIKRISPWVVKYLMKPMKDGLIGNRFLFKKLAKNLANNIIMENQYPDESIIKEWVENYFCFHRAVMSLEDLE